MNSKLLLCVIQYDIGQAKIAVKRENSLKREYIEKVRKKNTNSYLVRQKCVQ